jgi:uncharacterized protein YggU (UPF0235/DUF167 family)
MRGDSSTRLRLRVSPGSSETRITGRHGEGWKLRVAAAPEQGRANDAVLVLLARTLSLPRTAVTLVSGQGARDKIVRLAGLTPDEADRRLAAAVDGRPTRKEARR